MVLALELQQRHEGTRGAVLALGLVLALALRQRQGLLLLYRHASRLHATGSLPRQGPMAGYTSVRKLLIASVTCL